MLRYDEPLSRHTSFRIGGPAYCWIEPENPEGVLEAVLLAGNQGKPFIIVGKGTNFLFKDEGVDAVIIHLAKGFEKLEDEEGNKINSGAGLGVYKLVYFAASKGFSGVEFLTGIPGDLGGAIFMNAGVRNPEDPDKFIEIKDIILDIEVLDLNDRKIKTLNRKDIDFKYRHSGLDRKIVLGARFGLKKDEKQNIQKRITAFNKKRGWLTKIGFPNAGSVFKNPTPDKSAGMLIDACGLKGKRIGEAEISAAHANVIVNIGKAKAKDVLGLIDLARASVKQKFGIDLELEIKII